MKKEINKKYVFCLIWILELLLIPNSAFALDQDEKAWFGLNTQKRFSQNQPWFYTFFTQLRLVNENHPWDANLFEGGVGYELDSIKSIWLGSRITFRAPNHDFHMLYRLIQQLNWHLLRNDLTHVASRTRFEQEKRSDKSPISFQIRQRISLELKYYFWQKINPYFYDEIFFQLNHTTYTSNKLITQNRLLLGVNYYLSQEKWLEIGYINQFQWRRPQWDQNRMSHIFSLIYNF